MIRKKTVMILLSVFILTCSVPGTSIQVYANSDETVKTAFKNYIGTVLIPQYGLLLTNTVESTSSSNWTEADLEGLLSATIMDFDNDGQLEMMTVRFADYNGEGGIQTLFLEMYEYQDSGEVSVQAQKNMGISGYSFGSIGYRQKCIFTYTYQDNTYIGIDNYMYANESVVTLSVFEYGKGELQEVIVPHTSEVVYRTTFDYVGGVGYQLQGYGDICVRYAEIEPDDPLSCGNWNWDKMYSEDTDPVLSEEEKEEYMDSYKSFLEKYGLQASDERIGMSQNGSFIPRSGAFETAPDIYRSLEGNIIFLSGIYTDQGADNTIKQLTKVDYQGSLDEFRN